MPTQISFPTIDRDATFGTADVLTYNSGIVTVWDGMGQVLLQPGDEVILTGVAVRYYGDIFNIQVETSDGQLCSISSDTVRTCDHISNWTI